MSWREIARIPTDEEDEIKKIYIPSNASQYYASSVEALSTILRGQRIFNYSPFSYLQRPYFDASIFLRGRNTDQLNSEWKTKVLNLILEKRGDDVLPKSFMDVRDLIEIMKENEMEGDIEHPSVSSFFHHFANRLHYGWFFNDTERDRTQNRGQLTDSQDYYNIRNSLALKMFMHSQSPEGDLDRYSDWLSGRLFQYYNKMGKKVGNLNTALAAGPGLGREDEPESQLFSDTKIEDVHEAYTTEGLRDDKCRKEMSNYWDKMKKDMGSRINIFGINDKMQDALDLIKEERKKQADDPKVRRQLGLTESGSNFENPIAQPYFTNYKFIDDIPEIIACIALRKLTNEPFGKKDVFGPLDENGDLWSGKKAKTKSPEDVPERTLDPSAGREAYVVSRADMILGGNMKGWYKRVGDYDKWKKELRSRELMVIQELENKYDTQFDKPRKWRQKTVETRIDDQYYIVRYYAWKKAQASSSDVLINTLGIRKNDKMVLKLGYLFYSNTNLPADLKTKLLPMLDWR